MIMMLTIVVIIMMIKKLFYHKYEQHSILIYQYNDYHDDNGCSYYNDRDNKDNDVEF